MNSDQHARDGAIQIVKRDGSTEPFCFAKLLHCIQCGFQSSGEPYERHSANSRGLAEAVQTYLHEAEHDGPISSAHLAKLVELVLTQTGFSAAGMAIRRHAELRRRQRNWIKVAHRRDRDGHIVQKRWSRRHVVDILTESHRLGMTTARIISGRVEQVVFNCGLKVVTAEFVHESVNSELLAWGLLPGALAVKRKGTRGKSPRVVDPKDTA